jgi:hypothetical protein
VNPEIPIRVAPGWVHALAQRAQIKNAQLLGLGNASNGLLDPLPHLLLCADELSDAIGMGIATIRSAGLGNSIVRPRWSSTRT